MATGTLPRLCIAGPSTQVSLVSLDYNATADSVQRRATAGLPDFVMEHRSGTHLSAAELQRPHGHRHPGLWAHSLTPCNPCGPCRSRDRRGRDRAPAATSSAV